MNYLSSPADQINRGDRVIFFNRVCNPEVGEYVSVWDEKGEIVRLKLPAHSRLRPICIEQLPRYISISEKEHHNIMAATLLRKMAFTYWSPQTRVA